MKATYHFSVYRYEKGLEKCSVPCEILDETKTRFQIKLLASNVNGRNYGDIIWVRRCKVTNPKAHVDTTEEWWNN